MLNKILNKNQNSKERKEETENNFKHIPVMPKEVIKLLTPKKNGLYIDATIGGGGHAVLIANFLKKGGRIIGIDRDSEAIEAAKIKLAQFGDKISYVHDNFKNLDKILDRLNVEKADGILIDLGVSTHQLLTPKRGFSFAENNENLNVRLDMRMDSSQELTAYDIINKYNENQLKNIFLKLGEEPFGKKIARKIIQVRKQSPIITTNNLLNAIKSATPPKYRFSRKYGRYASKVFRAIRMEVNQELAALEEIIPKAFNRLKNNGRLLIISFHSLEDRIVKHKFKEISSEKKLAILLTKKPITATKQEIIQNPKATSAKLRAIEKI